MANQLVNNFIFGLMFYAGALSMHLISIHLFGVGLCR